MRSESEGQTEEGGELRAKQTRSKDPNRHPQTCARNCLHPLPLLERLKIFLQFYNIIGKSVGTRWIAAQRQHGASIGSRSASEAEIDSAGIERLERAELFRNDQW